MTNFKNNDIINYKIKEGERIWKKELKEKVQNEEYNRKIDRLIKEKEEELMKNASIEELQAMKK